MRPASQLLTRGQPVPGGLPVELAGGAEQPHWWATGIAVDVGSSTRPECDFDECFGHTVEGRWVAEHAAEFGLVVRYTAENSAVTGYAPESWHLRWVGRELAAHMRDTGVTTLEEVFDVPGGGYPD